ncbi:tripartite tricarboxylate transporter substrate binding protein [Advenella sp. FME57]|uniref:Bug family tripartite tricarboxylate transporter substrate binding protein n=1 Tax=Advenella sp. FME57 TaxID=2742604 RepID=UPI0018685F7D|nr:tripartite tricarboxylate transporter substrate binding protein [Advenella sp. FME57]
MKTTGTYLFIISMLAALAAPVTAQAAWPEKPITVIVPYTPGGATDTVSRVVMQKLSERLKQPIVIENKPGANGTIGTGQAARAKPDGYTFVTVLAAHSINPHLYKLNYSDDDFVPVSHMADLPLFLFINNAIPANNLKELVEYGKKNRLTYASSGIGSSAHLTGAHFAQVAGIQMTHVPYKGSAPILSDLLAGRVSMVFDPILVPMAYAKQGKLKALAITSAKRWEDEQDIPTMQEAGYKGFIMKSWASLMAPKGTPQDIIDTVSKNLIEVAKDPDVTEKFKAAGFVPVGSTSAELGQLIKTDSLFYEKIIKENDITVK